MPNRKTPSPISKTRVVRSPRRRSTVTARIDEGVLTVYLPAKMSTSEARSWIGRMKERILLRLQRDEFCNKDELEERARKLNDEYFEGRLKWKSLAYVTNHTTKYGSCTPESRSIRISHRMAALPSFVLNYVLFHELVHLVEPNHGRRFWNLVHRYPYTERAIGFLMGTGLVAKDQIVERPSRLVPPPTLQPKVAFKGTH